MPRPEVVIVGAARTPIGRYGGALRDVHPAELGAVAARAAMERAGITPDAIDEVLIGHGRQAGSGPNPARQVGARAGVPDTVPAQTINKACASGMQTIAAAAQSIMLGDAETILAGGIESMSRMPYLIDAEDARWGHKMGNVTLVDAMYRDGFTCSVCGMIMGETVEVLARQYGITREASDASRVMLYSRASSSTVSPMIRPHTEQVKPSRYIASTSVTLPIRCPQRASSLSTRYGMRLIDSMPPASTRSASPSMIVCAPAAIVCMPDAHALLMVCAGTASGMPALCPTWRAGFGPEPA